MSRFEYWRECIAMSAEECEAVLTSEQIEYIASAVEGAHETYGMYTGDDVATSNWYANNDEEKRNLQKELERERRKVMCRVCKGTGNEVVNIMGRVSVSQCWKCRGYGRHDP